MSGGACKKVPGGQVDAVEEAPKFIARISRDGEWFIASSPEFPEGNGQGMSEEEALESLRLSIVLLTKDREIDEGRRPSAWDHLSAFAGTADDDSLVPEREGQCRPAPELE